MLQIIRNLLAIWGICLCAGVRSSASDDSGASTVRQCLKDKFYRGTLQDRKVFSQFGEDGIISGAFECIHTTSKYFVELGVQDGSECTTRLLRENFNWTGLMMDGSPTNSLINLQSELMTSANIVGLLEKYKVPQAFDLLTVDIDLNTFWVLQSVLAGGYQPRLLVVEINRNFPATTQAFTVLNLPHEMWARFDDFGSGRRHGGSCYFGASPLALTRLLQFFGYVPLVFDENGINIFFVQSSVVGSVPPDAVGLQRGNMTINVMLDVDFTLLAAAEALPQRMKDLGRSLHEPCPFHTWMGIPHGVDFRAGDWVSQLKPTVLGQESREPDRRTFYKSELGIMRVHV